MFDDPTILVLLGLGALGYWWFIMRNPQTPLNITLPDIPFTLGPAGASGQTTMKTSGNGISLIEQFEGFSPTAYPDGAGYSIGYGHQIIPGDGLTTASVLTQSQALALLMLDLAQREAAINSLVTAPLNQNQFDALVSLVYNIGIPAFQASTLLKDLNAGDYSGAAQQFGAWIYAGGQIVAALQTRRAQEQALFQTQALV